MKVEFFIEGIPAQKVTFDPDTGKFTSEDLWVGMMVDRAFHVFSKLHGRAGWEPTPGVIRFAQQLKSDGGKKWFGPQYKVNRVHYESPRVRKGKGDVDTD